MICLIEFLELVILLFCSMALFLMILGFFIYELKEIKKRKEDDKNV